MMSIVGAVVEVTEGDTHVIVDPTMPIIASIIALLVLVIPVLLIILFFFYKKKQQTKMILAAMEKGLPVSDFLAAPQNKRKASWINNLSFGVGLTLLGLTGIIGMIVLLKQGMGMDDFKKGLTISIIVFSMGLVFLLRGILLRKYEKQHPDKEIHGNDAVPS